MDSFLGIVTSQNDFYRNTAFPCRLLRSYQIREPVHRRPYNID
ncbi:uncharacterized protein METZ01_LOCUS346826, partial [marine metagenome]